jgi:hypothetical protein
MLEKGTLHFHDFVHISMPYPLQSLKKKVFKVGSGYKIRGIPVFKVIVDFFAGLISLFSLIKCFSILELTY